MKFARTLTFAAMAAFALGALALAADVAPKFEIDTSWPKPLPKNWILGQIGGIFVDKDDNVWISQRPRTVNDRDKRAERGDKAICCYTAPSVIQPEGRSRQSLGRTQDRARLRLAAERARHVRRLQGQCLDRRQWRK